MSDTTTAGTRVETTTRVQTSPGRRAAPRVTTSTHFSQTPEPHSLRERTIRQPEQYQPDGSADWAPGTQFRGQNGQQHPVKAPERKHHFGLDPFNETLLFWSLVIPAWCLQIAAAVLGSLFHSWSHAFIATITPHFVLSMTAWLQTAVGMVQRASWYRDESDLDDRTEYLIFAVRLNRLMLPSAVISLAVFIQAYARRNSTEDLAYWLIFLLSFISNIVFSVMNAYNNIVWENDRLREEGEIGYKYTRLAVLGIPS